MLPSAIRRFFKTHGLTPRRIVVAASGGFDSTALLLALDELGKFDFVAAHVNHHLRGEESDGDEAFVRELCAQRGIDVHVAGGTLDAEAVRHRGIEAAAREVRFARLQEIRRVLGADFIATAHQKNDQAETVLMRLMSGGSPAALRGIHPVRDDGIVRPLLDVARHEIVAWLDERGIQPRIDRSNSDPRFLRNRVRKLLANAGPAAIDNLAQTAAQARAQWPVLERAIDAAEDAEISDDSTHFRSWPDDPWLRQALLHRHIVRLDPAHARDVGAKDLERLARKAKPRVSVTKELELVSGNLLRRTPKPPEPFELPLTLDQPATANGCEVRVTWGDRRPACPSLPPEDRRGACPPLSSHDQRIQLPTGAEPVFTVRSRRNGDRFHPLGYPAPTKLKDFLINRKVPREARDRLPLVVWNGEIVWIAGVAVSERFKTTEGGDIYVLSVQSRS